MNDLSSIWFLQNPIDLEHKQYILLAYLQKVDRDFKEYKLNPYFFDVKFHIQNIECFISHKTVMEPNSQQLTDEQNAELADFLDCETNSPEMKEVVGICKWAMPLLKKRLKDGLKVWKKIESSLSQFYIGTTPKDTSKGFLLVRYGGSHIVEAYSFFDNNRKGNVKIDHFGYYDMGDFKTYKIIKEQIMSEVEDSDPLFIGVESLHAFNTQESVLPVISQLLYKKVIS